MVINFESLTTRFLNTKDDPDKKAKLIPITKERLIEAFRYPPTSNNPILRSTQIPIISQRTIIKYTKS